jgi:hypothetical protein
MLRTLTMVAAVSLVALTSSISIGKAEAHPWGWHGGWGYHYGWGPRYYGYGYTPYFGPRCYVSVYRLRQHRLLLTALRLAARTPASPPPRYKAVHRKKTILGCYQNASGAAGRPQSAVEVWKLAVFSLQKQPARGA